MTIENDSKDLQVICGDSEGEHGRIAVVSDEAKLDFKRLTYNKRDMARMKVLESPALMEILKRMEDGDEIRKMGATHYLVRFGGYVWRGVSVRNIRTLESAGLIAPEEFDDYIEYRLTYSGHIEELVRGGKNE
jgi:hypothetical protein